MPSNRSQGLTPVRIAIGQFMEESNTFVRQRADLEHVRGAQLLYGAQMLTRLRGTDDDFEPEIRAVLGPGRGGGEARA